MQVPFAVLAVPAALAVPRRRRAARAADRAPARRAANLTLALLSAALTAALFLLVLLLVEGWRHSPATAALTVSVVPVAALWPRARSRGCSGPAGRVEVAVGCFLVAGGLVGLALPPSADLAWTIAPQALVGLGLGLTVDRLTAQAMRAAAAPRRATPAGRSAPATSASSSAWRSSRPVFTADLQDAQVPAQEAITALVLDAPLQPAGQDRGGRGARRASCRASRARCPTSHPRLRRARPRPRRERPAADQLERALDDQLERAATRAFRDSFLIGAALALLALLVVLLAPPAGGGRP